MDRGGGGGQRRSKAPTNARTYHDVLPARVHGPAVALLDALAVDRVPTVVVVVVVRKSRRTLFSVIESGTLLRPMGARMNERMHERMSE